MYVRAPTETDALLHQHGIYSGDCALCLDDDGIDTDVKISGWNPRDYLVGKAGPVVVLPPCGHTFHSECIGNALKIHRITCCPKCRAVIARHLLPDLGLDQMPITPAQAPQTARIPVPVPLAPAPNIPLCDRIRLTYRTGLTRSPDCIRRIVTAAFVLPTSAICGGAVYFGGLAITEMCFHNGLRAIDHDERMTPSQLFNLFFLTFSAADVSMGGPIVSAMGSSIGPRVFLATMSYAYAYGGVMTWEANSLLPVTNSTPGFEQYKYYDGHYHLTDSDGEVYTARYYSTHPFISGCILNFFCLSIMFITDIVCAATINAATIGAAAVRGVGDSTGAWMGRARPLQHLVAGIDVVIVVASRTLRCITDFIR